MKDDKQIKRIIIKGYSGYCIADEAFEDKIDIDSGSISYEYRPVIESEINPYRKWSYKTNSPLFKEAFKTISKMMASYIERDIDYFCTDIGGVEFRISYADGTRFIHHYSVPGDEFSDMFSVIKTLVPATEYTPAVLLTSEDFESLEDEE